MFPKRMFPNAYFAGTYFPPVTTTIPVPPVPSGGGRRPPPILPARWPVELDDEELMFWIL